MREELISVLVAWLPFVLLIVLLVAMARWQGMRSRGPSGVSLIELYEQQVAETRKMNTTLERIATALEQRARQPGS
jgi:ATP-dependent Zn protease